MLGSDRNLPSLDLFDAQDSAVRQAIVGSVVKIAVRQFTEPGGVDFVTEALGVRVSKYPRFGLLLLFCNS
jgi:hypothetical protein